MDDTNREIVQRFMAGTSGGGLDSVADLVHDEHPSVPVLGVTAGARA